jgi:predicted alpha/beta-hydrolase family hydrolase
VSVHHDDRRVDVPGGRTVSVRVARPAAHRPGHPAVILAHGAGTDMRHPSLAGFQDDLAGAGWPAVTFNFP